MSLRRDRKTEAVPVLRLRCTGPVYSRDWSRDTQSLSPTLHTPHPALTLHCIKSNSRVLLEEGKRADIKHALCRWSMEPAAHRGWSWKTEKNPPALQNSQKTNTGGIWSLW